jgi:hypothetical protein
LTLLVWVLSNIKMTSNKQDNNTPKMGAMLDANGEPIHFKYYLFAVRFGSGSGLHHAIQQDPAALKFCKYVVDNTNGQTISNDAITLKNDARDGYRHIDTLHSNRGCKCKAYKHSKMTDYGKTPIDQKLVESIISFWEQ